jgi:hypothetical protein
MRDRMGRRLSRADQAEIERMNTENATEAARRQREQPGGPKR